MQEVLLKSLLLALAMHTHFDQLDIQSAGVVAVWIMPGDGGSPPISFLGAKHGYPGHAYDDHLRLWGQQPASTLAVHTCCDVQCVVHKVHLTPASQMFASKPLQAASWITCFWLRCFNHVDLSQSLACFLDAHVKQSWLFGSSVAECSSTQRNISWSRPEVGLL